MIPTGVHGIEILYDTCTNPDAAVAESVNKISRVQIGNFGHFFTTAFLVNTYAYRKITENWLESSFPMFLYL